MKPQKSNLEVDWLVFRLLILSVYLKDVNTQASTVKIKQLWEYGPGVELSSIMNYECSKTKSEERDEILKGTLKYTCTSCFIKNPSLIAFNPSTFDRTCPMSKAKSLTIISHKTSPSQLQSMFKCTRCHFFTNLKEELQRLKLKIGMS